MASQLEFPATIGPFTMSSANLARAFNTFYQQNSAFPKPDPASHENAMIGMDPQAAGMGGAEMVFGQISPLHAITLDSETKAAANIPESATFFAWAYPMVLEPGCRRPTGEAEASFIEYGGYIYFNDHQNVVGTNSTRPASLGTLGLMFGRPQILPGSIAEQMTKQGRFQEITLEALASKGATHFGWIRPGEFQMEVASADGCFTYKFADGALKYFPVVSKPVFTQELVQETLDDSEAWVIIRNPASMPSIERPIIFARTNSLDENIFNNSHGVEVSGSFCGVMVQKDNTSLGSPELTYKEWVASADQGTITDPWIFTLIKAQSPEANKFAGKFLTGYEEV